LIYYFCCLVSLSFISLTIVSLSIKINFQTS